MGATSSPLWKEIAAASYFGDVGNSEPESEIKGRGFAAPKLPDF